MKFAFGFFLVFISLHLNSQPVGLHIAGGFANYSGELQDKMLTLNQSQRLVSAGGTFNLSDKFALRGDLSITHLQGNDRYSKRPGVVNRNLSFKTSIKEVSLMGEYTLFVLEDTKISPYVFAGVGVFKFNPYTYDTLGRAYYLRFYSTEGQGLKEYPDRKIYKEIQLNVPFGGGIKWALSDGILLFGEFSLRKLFTDYLDDVSATYVDRNILLSQRGTVAVQLAYRGNEVKNNATPYPPDGTIRGNPKTKDWYYFTQLGISFRLSWFNGGNFNSRKQHSNFNSRKLRLGCPPV